ncbi:Ion-translocating oxidoreductase complex subunit B [subsurface metagenome]
MAVRNIVKIDEQKCNGCGKCVNACVEGAIQLIDGKAKLVSDIYCDGLGACIGSCPQDAITIQQRDAADFDQEATKKRLAQKNKTESKSDFICPGLMFREIRDENQKSSKQTGPTPSQLTHWPIQLKLIPVQAPFLNNADLLLVADCVPFAMGDFHNKFLREHKVVVGCPKLDYAQFYAEKLAEILKKNKISSLTAIHMEVPCCSGLTNIAKKAVEHAGTDLKINDVTISLQGDIIKTSYF